MSEVSFDPIKIEALPLPKKNRRHRNVLLPSKVMRWCVIGRSGGGKTNCILDLIWKGYIDFTKLYIYAKSIEEPCYQWFLDKMTHLPVIVEDEDEKKYEIEVDLLGTAVFSGNSVDDFVPFDELDEKEKNLIIIDDFISDLKLRNNPLVMDYFIRGRKKNADVLALSQTIKGLQKCYRDNCSQFLLFREAGGRKDLQDLGSYLAPSISTDQFIQIYQSATDEEYSFLYVDHETKDPALRFRKNFDQILNMFSPEKTLKGMGFFDEHGPIPSYISEEPTTMGKIENIALFGALGAAGYYAYDNFGHIGDDIKDLGEKMSNIPEVLKEKFQKRKK